MGRKSLRVKQKSSQSLAKKRVEVFKLPKKYTDRYKMEIDQILEKLQLEFSKLSKLLTGDSVLAENTKKAYKKHFGGLKDFLILLGDYQSTIMLLT
jgi:hypothetical protein